MIGRAWSGLGVEMLYLWPCLDKVHRDTRDDFTVMTTVHEG